MINISKLYSDCAGVSDALRYPHKRDNKPIVVYNCTPQCNLRCMHCYSSSDASASAPMLSTEQAKQLIDQIADFGCPVLLFSGGEPLLRPDLFELMAHARAKSLRIVLSTNGTLLTDAAARRLAALNLSYAGISLDGPADIHDRFRGRAGAYKQTMQGVANCHSHGIRTGFRFTMTRQNIDHIEEIFRAAADNGVRRICFYHLIRTGRAGQLAEAVPSAAQVRNALDAIISLADSDVQRRLLEEVLTVGNHADGPYLLLRMQGEKHPNYAQAVELLQRSAGNRIGQNIASVNWDGQVYCDQFWRNYPLGNVLEQPFGDIWQNEQDPVMRILRNKTEYRAEECAGCKWLQVCRGNFRSLTGKAELQDWQNEPACYLTADERMP
jgi:radical SAM protein with 4Fe4S-binding SPASM domain